MIIVYAKPFSSYQQFGGDCPDGWVHMRGERPADNYVASETGDWIIPDLTYAQELTALTAPYNADRDTLCAAWLRAAVADGTEENVRKADVEAELAELDAQYDADVAALKTKYGVG